VVKHNAGTGNYKYFFPGDLVLKNNEIVQQKFRLQITLGFRLCSVARKYYRLLNANCTTAMEQDATSMFVYSSVKLLEGALLNDVMTNVSTEHTFPPLLGNN
jgi:hypothetical protein